MKPPCKIPWNHHKIIINHGFFCPKKKKKLQRCFGVPWFPPRRSADATEKPTEAPAATAPDEAKEWVTVNRTSMGHLWCFNGMLWWFIYMILCMYIYIYIYLCIYVFMYLFIYLFTYLFIYLFIYVFMYLYIEYEIYIYKWSFRMVLSFDCKSCRWGVQNTHNGHLDLSSALGSL